LIESQKDFYGTVNFGSDVKYRVVSEIVDFGEKSDFHGCGKNGKLFEEPATSFCHSAVMKIAPRKTLDVNNPMFRGAVKISRRI
jgi:hypothetical protein